MSEDHSNGSALTRDGTASESAVSENGKSSPAPDDSSTPHYSLLLNSSMDVTNSNDTAVKQDGCVGREFGSILQNQVCTPVCSPCPANENDDVRMREAAERDHNDIEEHMKSSIDDTVKKMMLEPSDNGESAPEQSNSTSPIVNHDEFVEISNENSNIGSKMGCGLLDSVESSACEENETDKIIVTAASYVS